MYDNLNKSVQVIAKTRPIKVAYLVPYEEIERTHLILDAVFNESYTRWGGARTLIIPTDENKFLYPEHESWLAFYDSDFIYSYVNIHQELIEKIDSLCLPMALLKHKEHKDGINKSWRSFLFDWASIDIEPLPSLTAIHNLKNTTSDLLTLIIQNDDIPNQKFVINNFGIRYNLKVHSGNIENLIKTFSFINKDHKGTHIAGHNATSVESIILHELIQPDRITLAQLAMMYSDGIPKVDSYTWSQAFNLFIGDSCLDRINFWNSRHLMPSWLNIPGSLIANKNSFEEGPDNITLHLGRFLNSFNYLKTANGPCQVKLRSASLSKEELETICNTLKTKTHNSVYIPEDFSAPAIPTPTEIKESVFSVAEDKDILKINSGSENHILAKEPEHCSLALPQFYYLNSGQRAIELEIDRHNNLSQYGNVIHTWKLPRRKSAAFCFTKQLTSKISKNNFIALIPEKEKNPIFKKPIKQQLSYQCLIVYMNPMTV